MDDTEAEAPRAKRKYKRRVPRLAYSKGRIVPPPTEPQPEPMSADDNRLFAGLTTGTCAAGCSEKGCVITGDVCGHPHKAGLQAPHRMKPAVMDCYERAKRFLKLQAIAADPYGKQRKEA